MRADGTVPKSDCIPCNSLTGLWLGSPEQCVSDFVRDGNFSGDGGRVAGVDAAAVNRFPARFPKPEQNK